MGMVEFTPEKLERFKKACDECEGDTFVFEGKEYLKAYAKYLIEFLDDRFRGLLEGGL